MCRGECPLPSREFRSAPACRSASYTDNPGRSSAHQGPILLAQCSGVLPSESRAFGSALALNGVESFWATLKRAHKGVFHKFSPKHLDRSTATAAGRPRQTCCHASMTRESA